MKCLGNAITGRNLFIYLFFLKTVRFMYPTCKERSCCHETHPVSCLFPALWFPPPQTRRTPTAPGTHTPLCPETRRHLKFNQIEGPNIINKMISRRWSYGNKTASTNQHTPSKPFALTMYSASTSTPSEPRKQSLWDFKRTRLRFTVTVDFRWEIRLLHMVQDWTGLEATQGALKKKKKKGTFRTNS